MENHSYITGEEVGLDKMNAQRDLENNFESLLDPESLKGHELNQGLRLNSGLQGSQGQKVNQGIPLNQGLRLNHEELDQQDKSSPALHKSG